MRSSHSSCYKCTCTRALVYFFAETAVAAKAPYRKWRRMGSNWQQHICHSRNPTVLLHYVLSQYHYITTMRNLLSYTQDEQQNKCRQNPVSGFEIFFLIFVFAADAHNLFIYYYRKYSVCSKSELVRNYSILIYFFWNNVWAIINKPHRPFTAFASFNVRGGSVSPSCPARWLAP